MHGVSGLCVYMVCVVCAYAWGVWYVRMHGAFWYVRMQGVWGVYVCMVCVVSA